MDDVNESEGPISAALFDTALLSVFNLFERFRNAGSTAIAGAKAFADAFSDPELLLNYLKAAASNPDTSGDASVEAIWRWVESNDDFKGSAVVLLVADAIIAYATQAMRAEEKGDVAAGWRYVGEARYWEGILNGIRMRKLLDSGDLAPALEIENPAVLMANRRHAASVAEKERILKYWEENIDPALSAAKAATQIVTSGQFSLEYRTVQSLISAAKKGRLPN